MFNQDEVHEHSWNLHREKLHCCECNSLVASSYYAVEDLKRLKSCTNTNTFWCALCEDCARQFGVVW